MSLNLVKKFNVSAGLILLGMATAHVIGNQGDLITQPTDSVLAISSRYLFWILAVIEVAVAIICLFGKSFSFPSIAVLWLTSNLLLYRLGLLYFGVKTMNPYYDTMASNFGISAGAMNVLLSIATVYLWLGSGLSLIFLRKQSKHVEAATTQNETDVVRA